MAFVSRRFSAAAARLPRVIFGTSTLGNLYNEPSYEDKKAVVSEIVRSAGDGVAVFDSAGKYGAGLALEVLGQALGDLNVPKDKVKISNKLAWKRIPLAPGAEPTFEPGAWVNLKNDAVQDISYQGMYDCFEEGNALLGNYYSGIASVHDPDEYLNAAKDEAERDQRRQDVLGAYQALAELKAAGQIDSVGVGAKDLSAIDWVSDHVQLDWAMLACSITPYTHTAMAKGLVRKLGEQGVYIINSAVFNAGFLIGGDHFDYRLITREVRVCFVLGAGRLRATCH
jgi:D-threo-aldose 1-dehydrogenase